jgi:hypothetical protein
MTSTFHEGIQFEDWYYKNDQTHLFFYHRNSLEWIAKQYDFASWKLDANLIEFKV